VRRVFLTTQSCWLNRINHMASEQSYTTKFHNKQQLVNTIEGDVIDAIVEVAGTLKYVQIMLLTA
jgi:hypothetical protein